MAVFQPQVGNVIAFVPRSVGRAAIGDEVCLTPRDRMESDDWHNAARLAGYDRMVIHNRDGGDAQEVGNFLSVYRGGQSWSRWGFARCGTVIRAWCCLTGADVGEFASLGEALSSVLNGMAPDRRTKPMVAVTQQSSRRSAVVTAFAPRLTTCAQSLGSAA